MFSEKTMSTLRFGFRYWKKYLPLSLLSKGFSLIAILCDLTIPLLSAGLLDYIIAYDPSRLSLLQERHLSVVRTAHGMHAARRDVRQAPEP